MDSNFSEKNWQFEAAQRILEKNIYYWELFSLETFWSLQMWRKCFG